MKSRTAITIRPTKPPKPDEAQTTVTTPEQQRTSVRFAGARTAFGASLLIFGVRRRERQGRRTTRAGRAANCGRCLATAGLRLRIRPSLV